MDITFSQTALILVTFFFAGVVKGVTGMGLPTLAMGVLGASFSPVVAASLMTLPSLVTNVMQMLAGPALRSLMKRFWGMLLCSALGTFFGMHWLVNGDSQQTTFVLGATLLVYCLYAFFSKTSQLTARIAVWLSGPAGLFTGLIAGATGVFVIPAVPYFQALGLRKDELVQVLGLSFTVSTLAMALALSQFGAFAAQNIVFSVISIVPALIGMVVGQYLRSAIEPSMFRRVFLLTLLLLSLEMLSRPFR